MTRWLYLFRTWCGPAFFVFLFVSILFSNSYSFPAMCGAEDACFREWVDALSGWAGAAGGAVAAYFLIEQIREQRRQTDFLVGDAMPTADILPHQEESEILVVRVTNWNARTLLIHRVEMLEPRFSPSVWYTAHDGGEREINNSSTRFLPAIRVPGWVNRDNEAHYCRIGLMASDELHELIDDWNRPVKIRVVATIVGTSHRQYDIIATGDSVDIW